MLKKLFLKAFPQYHIKQIQAHMIDEIFAFQKSNTYYFDTTQDHPPTKEECLEEMTALPPGKTAKDKLYIAFYEQDKIIAILDLIEGYPTLDTLYIGLFMLHKSLHQKHLGTYFLEKIIMIAKHGSYTTIELGCVESNEIAYRFWTHQNFHTTRTSIHKRNEKEYTIFSMQYKMIK